MLGHRPLKAYLQRPAEELYDLDADPDEINNLAEDPSHKETLTQLRTKLEKWQSKTGDPFLLRDSVSLTAIKGYVNAGESIDIPDRFEMPIDKPGSRDVPVIQWTNDGAGISSGFWSGD